MNELDLPPRRPLPAESRERALRTVLDGIAAPRRRRIAPLAAAAVVVAVLGATTAVALSGSPTPGGPEIVPRPAVVPSTVAPAPVEPALPAPAASDTPSPETGSGYVEPFERCKAAVAGSGRADEYPAVDGWTVTESMQVHGGVDRMVAIDDAFICFASPTTVRVSRTVGTPVGDVEVVRVGPDLFGVLNPRGASVSWSFGSTSGSPSTAPVQAVQLDDGLASGGARLTVVGAGSTGPAHVEPLPESAPDPMVVVDRPMPPRDSTTVDGAALDDCVWPAPLDRSDPGLAGIVTGESEPELWQPLARLDLPGGGFAISATIGEDYAGLCVRSGDYRYWWSREFRSADFPAVSALWLSTVGPAGPPNGGLFGLGTDVVGVDLTRADGTDVPCEVRSRLALCVGDDASGPLTLTLTDSAGVPVQQQVSFEDI